MAIYKLSELCDIINGSKVVTTTGHVPVVGSGGVFGYTNTSKTTEHSIALPRKGTMIIQYYSNPVWNVDTTYLATNIKKDKVYIKYLYYKLLNSNWKSLINGSTRPAMTKTEWSNFEVTIPDLNVQKEIIDIIEPVEELFLKYSSLVRIDTVDNCKNDISNLIDIIRPFEEMETLYKNINDKICCIENSIISSSSVTEQKFTFIKGDLPNKKEGPTMFLNVAAANGNPNRYVSNNPNVFIGDVTLSLDGNCGLVNNTLEGFNGYLYKVEVDNVDPWQIYYSLKTKYSQNTIKLNETGTTIKHAPGAKKELLLHTFEHSEYLKCLYMLRIQLHKNREIIIGSKKNLVKLLIK